MDQRSSPASGSPLLGTGRDRLLSAANAVAVGSLYLNQALLQPAAGDLPPSGWLGLIPLATLAGYAAGVGLIAFAPPGGRVSIWRHLTLLAGALLAAAMAPDAPVLALASLGVGLGAAVAQRLLAAAAASAGPAAAGRGIGRLIACALAAVLLVKLLGAELAGVVGWRGVFTAASACAAAAGWALRTEAGGLPAPPPVTACDLWRSSGLLRRIAFQQAALFGAFQAAWLLVLTTLPADERSLAVIGGGCAGLLAAVRAGWHSDRGDRSRVALAGSALILAASAVILPLAYGMAASPARLLLLLAGMAGIDAGLQVALVANQARAQAIRPDVRSRCAALLTVFGSIGGGLAAASAWWLLTRFGLTAALTLVAGAASAGLGCSLWPSGPFRHGEERNDAAIQNRSIRRLV